MITDFIIALDPHFNEISKYLHGNGHCGWQLHYKHQFVKSQMIYMLNIHKLQDFDVSKLSF